MEAIRSRSSARFVGHPELRRPGAPARQWRHRHAGRGV